MLAIARLLYDYFVTTEGVGNHYMKATNMALMNLKTYVCSTYFST